MHSVLALLNVATAGLLIWLVIRMINTGLAEFLRSGLAPVGPQEPPARRCVSLMWALRDARVPPMDYRHSQFRGFIARRCRVNI